jgi:hypothetical protein
MTNNLIQYASILDAAGAKLNLNTNALDLEVVEVPKGKKNLFQNAASDIVNYLDTRIYTDGLAAFAIASFIDGQPNAISDEARRNILETIGLTKNGQYISQTLSLIKINRSWHTSERPNECSYFGDSCTTRGIVEVSGKRGRKSTRSPAEYHERKSNGIISREQLVTPAVEALYRAIPSEMVTSAPRQKNVIRLDEIDKMSPEELSLILDKIKEVESRVNASI